MAKQYDEIDDRLRAWIAAQPMFFVATAPLAADGHVNVSPKGMDGTFAVLGPTPGGLSRLLRQRCRDDRAPA